VSAILSTVIINVRCSSNSGLPRFPVQYIYSSRPLVNKCSKHKIISYDPIKVDGGIIVEMTECESIFGFQAKDAGPVFNWIRSAEKLAKERCK